MGEIELITICDEIEVRLGELLPVGFSFDSELGIDGVHVYIGYLIKGLVGYGYIDIEYFFEICVDKNKTRGRYLFLNYDKDEYERGPWFTGKFEDLVHTAIMWWRLNDKRHS